ncbi:MAG: hypothetical protein M1814_000323, partial [Vezdaea aestivalis]
PFQSATFPSTLVELNSLFGTMIWKYLNRLFCSKITTNADRDAGRSVQWLLEHRNQSTQLQNQSQLRGREGDTPLASLYRLYVDIVVDDTTELRNEIEYFFRQSSWRVMDLVDPKDNDPLRYAILSALPSLLVPAFNRLIERGLPRDAPAIIYDFEELAARPRILEEAPLWCRAVPPLAKTLRIPNKDSEVLDSLDDPRASPELLTKNILAFKPSTYFV